MKPSGIIALVYGHALRAILADSEGARLLLEEIANVHTSHLLGNAAV